MYGLHGDRLLRGSVSLITGSVGEPDCFSEIIYFLVFYYVNTIGVLFEHFLWNTVEIAYDGCWGQSPFMNILYGSVAGNNNRGIFRSSSGRSVCGKLPLATTTQS